jgi:hypothetical protein
MIAIRAMDMRCRVTTYTALFVPIFFCVCHTVFSLDKGYRRQPGHTALKFLRYKSDAQHVIEVDGRIRNVKNE